MSRNRHRSPSSRDDNNFYRPPQGDFTFRSSAPNSTPAPSFPDSRSRNSHRSDRRWDSRDAGPRLGNYSVQNGRGGNGGFRGGRSYGRAPPNAPRGPSGGRGGAGGGFRRGRARFSASNRPMLQQNTTDITDEIRLRDADHGKKYKDFSELSDDEEHSMDESDSESQNVNILNDPASYHFSEGNIGENNGSDEEPRRKRVRTEANGNGIEHVSVSTKNEKDDGNYAPKWSNPDPYTALPPVSDSEQRKKRDVVKLIRKARMEPISQDDGKVNSGSDQPLSATAAATSSTIGNIPPVVDGSKPFPFAQTNHHSSTDKEGNTTSLFTNASNTAPAAAIDDSVPELGDFISFDTESVMSAPDSVGQDSPIIRIRGENDGEADGEVDTDSTTQLDTNIGADIDVSNLMSPWDSLPGTRKRNARDEIKPINDSEEDYVAKLIARHRQPAKLPTPCKTVVPQWQAVSGQAPCPWATRDYSTSATPGIRLTKEIHDFYEFVRPRPFEDRVRKQVIDNLQKCIRRSNNMSDCVVLPFGSYMSGIYLPTADIDIAICTSGYSRGGLPVSRTNSFYWRFRGFLLGMRLANPDSIEVITKAKVPIVKYVDRITGLHVDVSFENLSGVTAVKTFQRWKEDYPVLPMLVTLVKHYLTMRRLNEPVNGGIGGFSIICLCVSFLQMHPHIQSRNMNAREHIGQLFLEFMDLYGNQFNHKCLAIQLDPPRYMPKNRMHTVVYRNYDRLSVIDPNNTANDVSGGSSNYAMIRYEFSMARAHLLQRMRDLERVPSTIGDGPSSSSDKKKGSSRSSSSSTSSQRDSRSILEVVLAGNYSQFMKQRSVLRRVHESSIGPVKGQD